MNPNRHTPAGHEFSVMLAGLQSHLTNTPTLDWTTLLSQNINWSRVLAMCRFHEVTPLVYESLNPHLPKSISSSFRHQVLINAQHNFKLACALETVASRLEAEGIEAILLKGIILSERLFGDLAKRPTKDLDILVKEGDYKRAKQLLLESGYRGPLGSADKVAVRDPIIHNNFHHTTYLHEASGHYLELHTRLMPLGKHDGLGTEQLWAKATKGDWRGQALWTLPEDLLFLTLSLHASKHWWKRLKWLFDVSYLLDTQEIPEYLLLRARENDLLRGVLANALLSRELFGLELPHTVTAELKRTDVTKLGSFGLRRLERWPHTPVSGINALKFHLALSDQPILHNGWKLIRGKVRRDYGV